MMVQHHVKYKELHGIDEIVMMDKLEHAQLHRRLRKEGKCNVPVSDLAKISNAAGHRSPNTKRQEHRYNKSIRRAYLRRHYHNINFTEIVGVGAKFNEKITYNSAIGMISYHAKFKAQRGYVLPIIDIEYLE